MTAFHFPELDCSTSKEVERNGSGPEIGQTISVPGASHMRRTAADFYFTFDAPGMAG